MLTIACIGCDRICQSLPRRGIGMVLLNEKWSQHPACFGHRVCRGFASVVMIR